MRAAIASIQAVPIAWALVLTLIELIATSVLAVCVAKTIKLARQHDLIASFETRQANCPIGACDGDLIGSH